MTELPLTVLLAPALEAWPAVVGAGLIPFLGLIAVGYLIVRAVRDNDEEDAEEPGSPPT